MRIHEYRREEQPVPNPSPNLSSSSQPGPPAFARNWLIAAGVYNLVWGAAVILAPGLVFDLFSMDPPRYPSIWQCVGMIVGVYGVGYLIAASDPRRHWPIVLVGLLGKLLGPIGFGVELAKGTFPLEFGLTIITNDLIWWIPFAMILWDASRHNTAAAGDPDMDTITDQNDQTLDQLSHERPVLVTFTRHAGCTFCKEMLADLRDRADEIRTRGLHIAIVTMSGPEKNAELARRYDLQDASWFSDPDRTAYRVVQLKRGNLLQLFGPRVAFRGLAATLKGHGVGKLDGDGFQLAGAFVLHNGTVIRDFRASHAAHRPDYDQLSCEVPA